MRSFLSFRVLPLNQIILGDAIAVLKTLPDDSIDCCVTSPPYWNLRDYGMSGQIGNEPTMGEYIQSIVSVFAEVRRVLKPQGTCWLNLGDTYASKWSVNRRNVVGSGSLADGKRANRPNRLTDGLKEKDLCLIPHRCAIALQDDGWYVRQDLVWSKSNPMPESVRDRCTKAHEYIFLLTKSPKYFYDAEAIKEPASMTSGFTRQRLQGKHHQRKSASRFVNDASGGSTIDEWTDSGTRNKRSVWSIATKPCKEAHFATYPVELPTLCIKAGSPVEGVILDPFMGAGASAIAAQSLDRNFIGIELNPEYREMALRRIGQPGDKLTHSLTLMEVFLVALFSYLLIGWFVADDILMFPMGAWTIPLRLLLIVIWLPLVIRMILGSWRV